MTKVEMEQGGNISLIRTPLTRNSVSVNAWMMDSITWNNVQQSADPNRKH